MSGKVAYFLIHALSVILPHSVIRVFRDQGIPELHVSLHNRVGAFLRVIVK